MNSFQLVSVVLNSTDENKEWNRGNEKEIFSQHIFLVKQFMLLNFFDVIN